MMQVGHLVAVLAHDRGVEHACRRAQIVQYRLHRILDHAGDFFAEALEIFQILGELPAGPAVLFDEGHQNLSSQQAAEQGFVRPVMN